MGIDTTLSALQELGCRTPEVYDNGDIFLFRVWGKQLTSATLAQLANLNSRQRRIIVELTARGSCSSAQLQEALGENVRNIQRELRDLFSHGIIVAEGATSNRTYRLVS
jgi:predicted HTH transcriptional regulator